MVQTQSVANAPNGREAAGKVPVMTYESFKSSVVIFSTLTLLSVSAPAWAATKTDLAGKKICWSDDVVANFYADGKFANNRHEEGTWSVRDGVLTVKLTNGVTNSGTLQLIDDKTLHYVGSWNGDQTASNAKYCD
jgi:hypothetical protein